MLSDAVGKLDRVVLRYGGLPKHMKLAEVEPATQNVSISVLNMPLSHETKELAAGAMSVTIVKTPVETG